MTFKEDSMKATSDAVVAHSRAIKAWVSAKMAEDRCGYFIRWLSHAKFSFCGKQRSVRPGEEHRKRPKPSRGWGWLTSS